MPGFCVLQAKQEEGVCWDLPILSVGPEKASWAPPHQPHAPVCSLPRLLENSEGLLPPRQLAFGLGQDLSIEALLTFWPGMVFAVEGVLCTAECLASSPASIH